MCSSFSETCQCIFQLYMIHLQYFFNARILYLSYSAARDLHPGTALITFKYLRHIPPYETVA